MIYVIRAGATDKVKIGWADEDAEARRRTLQCGHHEELRIIRLIDAPRGAEGWLHRHYAKQRLRGEWFTLVPSMLTIEIGALPVPPPAQALPDCDLLREIDAFLAAARMTATMFGARSVKDPRLVHDMRLGRECKRAIRARIRAFIAASAVSSEEAA